LAFALPLLNYGRISARARACTKIDRCCADPPLVSSESEPLPALGSPRLTR